MCTFYVDYGILKLASVLHFYFQLAYQNFTALKVGEERKQTGCVQFHWRYVQTVADAYIGNNFFLFKTDDREAHFRKKHISCKVTLVWKKQVVFVRRVAVKSEEFFSIIVHIRRIFYSFCFLEMEKVALWICGSSWCNDFQHKLSPIGRTHLLNFISTGSGSVYDTILKSTSLYK